MVMTVVVTTAPRPVPTLPTCLRALALAGGPDPLLIEDRGIGIVRTWRRALETVVDRDTDVGMVVQDDVTWPPASWARALEALATIVAHDPGFGYASLHTMPRVQDALRASQTAPVASSWYPTGQLQPYLRKGRWCGAQCWMLTRETARRLVDDRRFSQYAAGNTHGFDHEVTATLQRFGQATYTWWPSLVSHALGKGNRAPRWPRVAS